MDFQMFEYHATTIESIKASARPHHKKVTAATAVAFWWKWKKAQLQAKKMIKKKIQKWGSPVESMEWGWR